MQETARVGQTVSPFEMDVYDPARGDFGRVSLKELTAQGKWVVLVFYPGDYTFVCPTELADVAKHQEELTKAGAVLIGVSTDSTFVHLAWQREEPLMKNVRFLLGADRTGAISRLFGVYDEAGGTALRGTFVIAPDGRLTASE